MKNRMRLVAVLAICVVLSACGKKEDTFLYFEKAQLGEEELEATSEAEEKTAAAVENQAEVRAFSQSQMQESVEICIYICGAVERPGVYQLEESSRICDALELAGGYAADAQIDYWNLAERLLDGQMIYVPTVEEAKERDWDSLPEQSAREESLEAARKDVTEPTQESPCTRKINLNTATKEELMTIPGVGEAKADSIISYRKTNGDFRQIEDVMNISGIKEGLFGKIKEYITVE